jgi:hypothetical protein
MPGRRSPEMPDIAMCKGEDCPKKQTCYRYRAIPNPLRQAYGDFHLELEDGGQCGYYWDITDSDAVNISVESVTRSDKELSDVPGSAEARIKHLEEVAKESYNLLEEFLYKVDLNEPDKFAWKLALSNLVSKLRD